MPPSSRVPVVGPSPFGYATTSYLSGVHRISVPRANRLPLGFAAFRPDLGRILARRRRERFGPQKRLAGAAGIARETLSRIEAGRTLPAPGTIDRLLALLELDWVDVALPGAAARPARYFDGSSRGETRHDLGVQLRRGRRSEGLSLRALGERCGASAAQLSRIERGEGPRSRLYEEYMERTGDPGGVRSLRFRHPELRRLASLG